MPDRRSLYDEIHTRTRSVSVCREQNIATSASRHGFQSSDHSQLTKLTRSKDRGARTAFI